MGALDPIIAALSGNSSSGGTGNASKRDSRPMNMSPKDANMAKMKALGINTMPGGGQDQLDQMWSDHVKRVNGAK